MFTHIVCPVDGSECSAEALVVASRLAAEQHAELTLLEVVDPAMASTIAVGEPVMSASSIEALQDDARHTLADAAARLSPTIQVKTVSLTGFTIETILDYTKTHPCDLIVMGSHGRSGLQHFFLGSVAEGVLRQAPVPVMIVRWARTAAKIPQNFTRR